ncbi:LuxR family transcriptional regulator [Mesorhizobium sp. M1A.F.Ca.ET.072.01.1.1]|uniref:autoinducer binding domain-containing protein n=1 Tax=Mesorhizobium sp. M1A.F.Ca.ET.072.01.1.1 TaxID=2496753 RepID=UPI000FD359B5|nr:autoinducer binding domain-containing protein [Mesorhizobium sp. M1A.F.Ca.ET.072.01.1.1]RUW54082.1 LuxR family transcriptional regulator [Mesorhizobium sp. M1A.F.Ca.ET.072.01.1.1]TIV03406.1 MAG: LuxR family transcriptional regulator [Mesorhizobium sp.]
MQFVFETFLERLSESVDERGFRDAMAHAAAAFDLVRFAYLSLPPRAPARPRLISNYPSRWTSRYLSNRYHVIDPVIARAQGGQSVFLWGLHDGRTSLSQFERKLFDEAAAFGIRCGLTIPILDKRGNVAAMSFAADRPDPALLRVAERYEDAFRFMATCFHVCVRRKLSADRVIDGVQLTPREYECLEWAVHGKSARDIGSILGIKRRTAAFHLDNAIKKLGVRTRTQAVARFSASRKVLG